MLGLIDADYTCLCVDIGANGSASNAKVFNACELKEAIDSGKLNFPDPAPLPHGRSNPILSFGRWCISFADVDNEAIFQT